MTRIISFSSFTLLSFQILILSLYAFTITPSSPQLIQDAECQVINCGQGKCVASNATVLGVDCDCNPGWKEVQIGPLTLPSCVVPNCSVNFQCGNGVPPPPPPPPALPPPFNASNPCNLVWCGDGTCVANGTGHYCQCNDGSSNLLDQKAFACFKQCFFGADCKGLGFGQQMTPPAPSSSSSRSSGSPKNGSNNAPNFLANFQSLITVVLSATFLAWFQR